MRIIWKIIKLIPTIIKNFFLIILEEIVNLFRKMGWLWSLVLLAVLAGAIGGGFFWYKKERHFENPEAKMTLEEAAKIGEVTTHKLLVQIEIPKGNPEDLKGRYERGDIVQVSPGDKEFSEAEKTGFLILKMDLTDKQGELLMRALEIEDEQKDPDGRPMMKTLKRRKYAIDLQKIGIGDDVQRGRVVEDIYKWDIVKEKEEE
jgi:hypothetical protein